MRRFDVINYLLDERVEATYLEIGLATGENWFRVRAARKIGVEPRDVFTTKKVPWYGKLMFRVSLMRGARIFAVTSDEFFDTLAEEVFAQKGIDVAFIDGWHSYAQSLRDVNGCLRFLKRDGVIVLHDCNPLTAAATAPTPAEALALSQGRGGWNGDVWKTIVHLRSQRADLQVCVVDCDEGLGIVRRGPAEYILPLSTLEMERLTFSDLERDRLKLLNLRDAGEIIKAPAH